MSHEHEFEQFDAAMQEFSKFFDEETKHDDPKLRQASVKNLAFVCWMRAIELTRERLKKNV